ncbi:hypothetical protein Pmani_007017 [Petrolisthes manimaculis]|uniref:Uncharacterized protein n=1 Tax=Petrolisthes manimaculis TaxID=1843537 RepID=A0AAE1UL56_9EUCA|nr:hypothetical protein Pmani_007017 [Petrolisthes manimaculis]
MTFLHFNPSGITECRRMSQLTSTSTTMKKDQKNTSGKILKKRKKRFAATLSVEVTTYPATDPTYGPSDPVTSK